MKRSLLGMFMLVVCFSNVGCFWRPYHEAVLVDIDTNEVPFLINLEEVTKVESQKSVPDQLKADFLRKNLVQSRRLEIPHRFKSMGRMPGNGRWIPTQRLILVDTTPETREWTSNSNSGTKNANQGIWVESSDSVGFSTGISITARIDSQNDAVHFLSNYPPKRQRKITEQFSVDVTSLEEIMDTEIRTKIQEVFANEAAKYNMDELRTKKNEIMTTVRETVTPFFAERGIDITTIGQFGGFTYENPKIQESIDKVFEAQQDEEVAKAEAKAAEQRREALKLKGEGEAAQVLEAKRGEAEGVKVVAEAEADAVKLIADAKAYELQQLEKNPETYLKLKQLEIETQRLEAWDGKYPMYFLQLGKDSNASPLITLPQVPKDK